MKETVLFLIGCLVIVGAVGVVVSHMIGVSVLAPKPAVPFEFGDGKAGKSAPVAEKPKRISKIVKPSVPEHPAAKDAPRAPEPDQSAPVAILTPALPFPVPEEIGV